VELAGVGRVGWLTQPGWLIGTSAPTRTSPVRRGAFVLDALLCAPPGAPPPGVPPLADVAGAGDLRSQLAAHRANPTCATCHDDIDPIGLALEHFDAVGAWREADAGVPIDAHGQLPDGTEVDGAADLAAALLADDRFPRCAAEQALTWALGRRPGPGEAATVTATLDGLRDGGGTLEALLVAVVTSDAFRTREVTP
jgi:hypothetical protein